MIRRREDGNPPAPPAEAPAAPEPEADDMTVSDETRRAQLAADRAAADLVATRQHAVNAAESADALAEENRHNGFYLLIRQAMGIG